MAKKKKDDHHHSPPKPDPDGGGERPAPPQDPAPDWAEMPGFRRHDRMTPADLIGRLNPQNPKIHGDDQLASIRESIRRFGWIVPVVLNERTGRLVDGHARVKVAAADGMADVPVVIGDWSEDEEREILAVFDAIGAQAGLDAEKFRALKSKITMGTPALRDLLVKIDTDPWFKAGLGNPRELLGQAPISPRPPPVVGPGDSAGDAGDADDFDPDGVPEPAIAPEPAAPRESDVRMVQLFMSVAELGPFYDQVAALQERWGTDNLTATVVKAVAVAAAEEAPAAAG